MQFSIIIDALSSPFSFCNINYHAGGTLDLVSFLRSRLATRSLYLEKTVLGDVCVGLIIEAMNTGVRINSSHLSGYKIDDEVMEGLLSSKYSQYVLELDLMLAE